MFTGLIEEIGKITKSDKGNNSLYLTVECTKILDGLKIGDSVAINGACQTVTDIYTNGFKIFASSETLAVTTFKSFSYGTYVNLERTLRLCDRLDGHIVSGHVDGTALVSNITRNGGTVIFTFTAQHNLLRQIVHKGSVTIDGISLTVSDIDSASFKVAVIPHTYNNTTLKYLKTNDTVNLETDIISKYVEKYLSSNDNNNKDAKTIDINLLERNGFI